MKTFYHYITHINAINTYLTPWIKYALCIRENSLFRYSPGFQDPAHQRTLTHEDFNSRSAKVMICGLPKSGNSWLVEFFCQYLNLSPIHPFFDHRDRGVCMNHFVPKRDVLFRKDILRSVYIMRDIRDVICSYYHYASTPYHLKYVDATYPHYPTIEEFYFEYFLRKVVPRYNWLENADTYKSLGIAFVRYEDLKANPAEEFRSLIQTMNIRIVEEDLQRAVRNTDFSVMKNSGGKSQEGSTLPSLDSSHFRKGRAGSWKDELTERVQESILLKFGEYLKRWGYSC